MTMTLDSPAGRRVAVTAASISLLCLGVFLRGQLPNPGNVLYSTFDYAYSAPQLGDVSEVTVTTTKRFNGLPTHATWVIIDFAYEPKSDLPIMFGEVNAADGTEFLPERQLKCDLKYPNLRTDCMIAFEMPEDKIAGSTLRLTTGIETMAAVIEVPLENPVAVDEVTWQ